MESAAAVAGPASACAAAVAASASACAAAAADLLDGGAAGAWGPQAGSDTSCMGILLCTADADANEEEVGGGLVLVEGLYSAERTAAAAAAEASAAAVADLLDAAAACLGTNLGLTGAPAITSLLQDFLVGCSSVHSPTPNMRQTEFCKNPQPCQQVHS
jgi:hypothetical protein